MARDTYFNFGNDSSTDVGNVDDNVSDPIDTSGDDSNALGSRDDSGGSDAGSIIFGGGSNSGGGNSSGGSDSAGSRDERFVYDSNGNVKYNKDGSPRKRRGRKPGSTSSEKLSVREYRELIHLGHAILANVTRTPELELSENEAAILASPTADLLDFYNVKPPKEAMIWARFFTACSYVYGPRAIAINMRLKEEAAAKRAKKVGEGSTAQQPTNPKASAVMPAGLDPKYNGIHIGEPSPFGDPSMDPNNSNTSIGPSSFDISTGKFRH